jgi:hypothetical protein
MRLRVSAVADSTISYREARVGIAVRILGFDDFRADLRGCSSIIAAARRLLSYTF